MVEVHRDRYTDDRVVVHKHRGGRTVAIALIIVLAIVGILFATGFWKADVSGGDVPEVSVKGGELPKVDVDSKAVVVGTKKETIDVPTVGVKDNGEE
ncbi:hypothetical protein H5V43_18680 [Sphingobium fuliginis]|uniref:Uncharacterized protein n=3 Tax=Sphingomonadaceae TaxID=41297 RepID=A0A4Q4IXG0_SPHSA|nr:MULTISPECIES: hypothetical protein [Sphingobium]KXU31919.1 hypothetical protein AXW74_10545 [Sphingobium sp. AM]KYC33833.1 hypothetical protein A0J57_03270 [Sphingobium sp. 22B]OAP33569.1 hypothetical protein A8O16_02490 [Sphingobium sp. 20006FA]PNP99899.1 hypothetical protein A8G00_18280 [Sphingobium sp. SA916]QDC40149.1 hypothetical protein FIL70_22285 [Sphingobium fuliginis ATCC 27551]